MSTLPHPSIPSLGEGTFFIISAVWTSVYPCPYCHFGRWCIVNMKYVYVTPSLNPFPRGRDFLYYFCRLNFCLSLSILSLWSMMYRKYEICLRYPIPKSLPSGKGLSLLFLPFELVFVLVSMPELLYTMFFYGRHHPHFYRENVVDTLLEQGICHTFVGKPWMVYPISVRSLAHSS